MVQLKKAQSNQIKGSKIYILVLMPKLSCFVSRKDRAEIPSWTKMPFIFFSFLKT